MRVVPPRRSFWVARCQVTSREMCSCLGVSRRMESSRKNNGRHQGIPWLPPVLMSSRARSGYVPDGQVIPSGGVYGLGSSSEFAKSFSAQPAAFAASAAACAAASAACAA